MKVLLINGSPHTNGNTMIALQEMENIFIEEGIETEIIQVGSKNVHGCVACGNCWRKGECSFDDIVNKTAAKFEQADGIVVGSPVYYASANPTVLAFMDRLFYSTNYDKTMKVGAAVAIERRNGNAATFDELNKYFSYNGMPVVSSQFWDTVYSENPGEILQDADCMRTMRILARNMSFLMKSISLGRKEYGLPEKEEKSPVNIAR